MEEVKNDLLKDISMEDKVFPLLDSLVKGDSRYIKDLRLNIKKILKPDALDGKEIALCGMALAANVKNEALLELFERLAEQEEVSEEEKAEALACTSLLAANNVLYRFRHFVDKDEYQRKPAKIRMNIMMKPVLGKEFFELISLAVSAVNGCEACVKSHEQSVISEGGSEDRIWQVIRMASVINSMDRILN